MQGLGSSLSVIRGKASYIPDLPSALLSRQRLIDALLGKKQRLRVLCAPAGFGKTVLLSEFLQQVPPSEHVVWLSLAGQPLALPQLISRVTTELGLARGRVADGQALLQFFETCGEPIWLVLDDYPNEAPAELSSWIMQLLALQSSKVQLLVSCRQRPDWNLSRLLLRGELLELDASQLALSRDEFELLVCLLAPQTSASAREELWQQTAGWCAGVRLLLSGQMKGGKADGSGLPWLRDYLEHELLSRLGEGEREILYRLAHFPKISAELCDQLWEEQGGGLLFKRLLQCQSFLLPVDRQGVWYRMLPAVAHALQDRLSAPELSRLRLRSCRVLSAAGYFDEAIEQALCAEQPEVAANYMESLGLDWLFTDQHLRQLLSWREQLPPQLLESTPRLICLCARALLFSWRLEESEACIARLGGFLPQAESLRNTRLLANWQALQGTLEGMRGNAEVAREHCQAALSHLPARDWHASLLCYSTLARIAMATGQSVQAHQLLLEAVELARRQGCLVSEVLVNTDRIRLLILRGDLSQAEALLQENVALVEDGNRRHSLLLGRLLFLQGELHLLRGGLDECESALQAGFPHALDSFDPLILHGYLVQSELDSCRGEYDQALVHLHEAERRMHCGKAESSCYKSAIDLQSMRILARQGCWEQLPPIAQSLEAYLQGPEPCLPPLHMPSLPQRNQLLLALAEYETGSHEQAEQRLRALHEQCKRRQFGVLMSEVQLALAKIGFGSGRSESHGLELQARQQVINIGCYSLLQGWTDGGAEAAPQPKLSASFSAGAPLIAGGQADLTLRELSVLKLLAEGLSNQEIGNTLFISVNTVKTHTKKINAKLGVKRRTQAINRAKALGILL
ncbi:ATP-dependent transcriptional regulator [Pseudomonas cavernae]|uniref:ATP-dependent transcriptional regulator n=1 Tax=Pseudomonas cavernae TaxID=2320867 RepID=A0A385Z466_9PSED|nr:LuxR C-terminal-related transcriptional regulator [Pseudomonas cavernae]AYC34089.1 ATP-dependent transcriptional regulator [Pseudomonas cavernae]